MEPDLDHLVRLADCLRNLKQLLTPRHLVDGITALEDGKLLVRDQSSHSALLLSDPLVLRLPRGGDQVVVGKVSVAVIAVVPRARHRPVVDKAGHDWTCRQHGRLPPHQVVLQQSLGHRHVDLLEKETELVLAVHPTQEGLSDGRGMRRQSRLPGHLLRVGLLDQLVHAGNRVGEHVWVEAGGWWEEKMERGGGRTGALLVHQLSSCLPLR